MAFRDDKDALVERLAELERDLKETREGLERKDEELRRLRERLGGLDPQPSDPRRSARLVGIGVALVAVAGAAWLSMTKRPPPPVARVAPPPPVVVEAATPPATPSPVVAAPATATPAPTPSADLTWKAKVRTSTGPFAASVKPGAPCTIDVTATGGAELDFDQVAVTCGDTVVYDTRAPVRGTMSSQTSGSLTEMPKPGGGFVYRVVYRDVGTRTLEARPQLEMATERRIARVYHEGVLGGAVDLAIDQDSQPRSGEPLAASSD